MPYVIVDDVVVWVDAPSATRITALDGSDDSVNAIAVTSWRADVQSSNNVTVLLNGDIAATVLGDPPQSGTFNLLFDNDSAADAARILLGRRTTFQLTDDSRPVVNMQFVRMGALSTPIHDSIRQVWEFNVGFQEVNP